MQILIEAFPLTNSLWIFYPFFQQGYILWVDPTMNDGLILWLPVLSLSYRVIWISCPLLLKCWARFQDSQFSSPEAHQTNLDVSKPVYLKDAIFKAGMLQPFEGCWQRWIAQSPETSAISRLLVLSDRDCATVIQMGLWRQVKVKLDEHKTVAGGFRYEEAIPPDTLMYFPWGTTTQANGTSSASRKEFQDLIHQEGGILQIGGQESLGRGFVQAFQKQEGSK